MESEIKNLQSENNILHVGINEYIKFITDNLTPDLSRMKNLRGAQELKINSLAMDISALEKIILKLQAQLATEKSSGLETDKVTDII